MITGIARGMAGGVRALLSPGSGSRPPRRGRLWHGRRRRYPVAARPWQRRGGGGVGGWVERRAAGKAPTARPGAARNAGGASLSSNPAPPAPAVFSERRDGCRNPCKTRLEREGGNPSLARRKESPTSLDALAAPRGSVRRPGSQPAPAPIATGAGAVPRVIQPSPLHSRTAMSIRCGPMATRL